MKDALEQVLPAARCYSVTQNTYHVLNNGGHFILAVADNGPVTVRAAG